MELEMLSAILVALGALALAVISSALLTDPRRTDEPTRTDRRVR